MSAARSSPRSRSSSRAASAAVASASANDGSAGGDLAATAIDGWAGGENVAAGYETADEVIAVAAPFGFAAVGQYYRRFDATEDAEVARLLARGPEPAADTD